MSPPEWLPDWANIKEYPDPIETQPREWVWEFLRRNPEYQADYAKVKGIVPDIGIGVYTQECYKPIRELEEKWRGVPILHADPSLPLGKQKKQKILNFEALSIPGGAFYLAGQAEPVPVYPEKPGDVVLKFNLCYPIAPQLEQAKRLLKQTQKRLIKFDGLTLKTEPKHNGDTYVKYLRLLDAIAHNIDIDNIGETLKIGVDGHGDFQKTTIGAMNAACSMRDEGFWLIPFKTRDAYRQQKRKAGK